MGAGTRIQKFLVALANPAAVGVSPGPVSRLILRKAPSRFCPMVSVIVPIYNAEATLVATLDSVLHQEGVDLEVIAVDDFSRDQSASILENRAAQDPRLKVIKLSRNIGQSAALNRGVEAATGDYVKFLDADDLLSLGHLSAQVAALEETSRHLAGCRWASFADSIEGVLPRDEHTSRDYDDPRDWILDSMEFDEGMMPGWRWLIPRRILEDAGGWDERLSLNNDFEFSIRLLDHTEGIRFAEEAILYYRQGVSGTLSKRLSRRALESAWLTTELGCGRILDCEDGIRARRLCADRMQDWLFRFYPEHPDLATQVEKEIARLGGSNRQLRGGTVLRILSKVLSWKSIRRLQTTASRLGWSKIQHWKSTQRYRRHS